MAHSLRTKLYVGLIVSVALCVIAMVFVLAPSSAPEQIDAAVFFSFAAFVAHQLAYRLPRGGFGDIGFIPLLSGVAIAPGLPMIIGAGTAFLVSEYMRRREPIRVIFNAAQVVTTVGVSSWVYVSSGGTSIESSSLHNLLPLVLCIAAFFICNAMMFAGVVATSSTERFAAVLARAGRNVFIYDLIAVPIVFGFSYAYSQIGWLWSGALLLPLLAVRQIYKVNRDLETVNEELLQLMVAAIEARDPYTSGHSQRVATYSRIVSQSAGLSERASERVYTAALLHDVGKIHEEFAPILRKPGRLTESEFAVMKSHSEKGAALVSRVSQFVDLIPAIRGHHEAWDGSGYPDGLAAEKIPLWARIITFADTIDAMTTDRPYRAALNTDAVRAEIRRQAGKQFDPRIAEILVADLMWLEMAKAIRQNRFTHVPQAEGQQTVPRHSASLDTPYAGVPAVGGETAQQA